MNNIPLIRGWRTLRGAIAENDTAITTFDYDSWPAAPLSIKADKLMGGVSIAFFGKDAENRTAAYKLYGRRETGPIMLLASGVLTLGSQLVTKHPLGQKAAITAYWVDTITVGDEGMKPAIVSDSGNNRIAYLEFDTYVTDLYLEVTLDGGGGTAMTELQAIYTGQ